MRKGKNEHSIWKLLEHVGFARKKAPKYDLVLHDTVPEKEKKRKKQKRKEIGR